jgi:nitroreductase/Pyruvate/2-oxoacid:ferredoxin oxidoreductase delta subunit
MPTITRDADRCAKCGICVLTCPVSAYVQESKDSVPEVAHAELCVSCGHCVAVCPRDAITHSEFPEGKVTSINRKVLPSAESVIEFLRTRRSTRAFKDQPVERHLIEGIIEAARCAPSSENSQSTEFMVIQDREVLENIVQATCHVFTKLLAQLRNPIIRQIISIMLRRQAGVAIGDVTTTLEHAVAEIREGRDIVLHNAPVLVLFHALARGFNIDINAQLAIQNAALMAHAQGLGSFYTGYLMQACERDKTIPQLVKIPENHKIYGGLALGYPRFQYQKWMERKPPQIRWL